MRSLITTIILAFAGSASALAASSGPLFAPRVVPVRAMANTDLRPLPPHVGALVSRIQDQQQLRMCMVPSYFGSVKSSVIKVVYYTTGSMCGLPPFYGFAFGSPSKP